jgi:fumarylacetoacetate (FAA) hydrolase
MKMVTYIQRLHERLGIMHKGEIYSVSAADPLIPDDMIAFLRGGEAMLERALFLEELLIVGQLSIGPEKEYQLVSPVPRPASCRDGYAFRQHVAAGRRNRGVGMIPEFDQYPVFYFTNHQAVCGPGTISCMPDHFQKLDFELEVAIVIGKGGRNIRADKADAYIAGYTIMNDLSARTLQMEEMLLSLGPAKGKDFATALGPWLVTPDELGDWKQAPKAGHNGNAYNLEMTCKINGKTVSTGNMADMDWTFAELIERASYGCDLYPGDVIGSGTVGTGCFLELNGTGKLNDPNYREQWLQPGDVVEMEVTGLGILSNTIVAENTDWSILKIKK